MISSRFFCTLMCFLGLTASLLSHGYELKVEIEDKPLQGPRNKPGYVEERWGSKEQWQKGAVIHLNDNNFEHLTQAASGATSGDWFVMFGAPWCKFCTEEMMVLNWNHTSRELYREVSVGYIDASNNPFTAMRFKVEAYPEFYFLRKGRAYRYKGPRYWKEFVAFARLDWEKADSFEIPPAHGTWDDIVYRSKRYLNDVYVKFQHHPKDLLITIFIATIIFVVLPYGYIFSAPYNPDDIVRINTDRSAKKNVIKVWNPETGETQEIEAPEPSNEADEPKPEPEPESIDKDSSDSTKIKQVEVDADTVEIITEPSETSSKPVERKSKKKSKKQ